MPLFSEIADTRDLIAPVMRPGVDIRARALFTSVEIRFLSEELDFHDLADQFAISFIVADRAGHVSLQVFFEYQHAERAKGADSRRDLFENIHAIPIGFHHFFNASNLAFDPADPVDIFFYIVTAERHFISSNIYLPGICIVYITITVKRF